MSDEMREEYDIKSLNPRKNPYAGKNKKAVTMNISVSTLDYFKSLADESGIPYQVLMNFYLEECVKQKKKLQFV
ncbi:MAG: antitoxin [Eubacteriales bacterium]|nr:antitoxin [Eubacteriales bacterium]